MKDQILEILASIRPELDFNESDDFFNDGYLDSFDLVSLVAKLDATFNISIRGDSILPENFKDVDAIISLIKINK